MLINFLIRVALIAGETKDGQGLSEQCVTLLDSGLGVWPDANIKLQYFDKQISSSSDAFSALLTGANMFATSTVTEQTLPRYARSVHSALYPQATAAFLAA